MLLTKHTNLILFWLTDYFYLLNFLYTSTVAGFNIRLYIFISINNMFVIYFNIVMACYTG